MVDGARQGLGPPGPQRHLQDIEPILARLLPVRGTLGAAKRGVGRMPPPASSRAGQTKNRLIQGGGRLVPMSRSLFGWEASRRAGAIAPRGRTSAAACAAGAAGPAP